MVINRLRIPEIFIFDNSTGILTLKENKKEKGLAGVQIRYSQIDSFEVNRMFTDRYVYYDAGIKLKNDSFITLFSSHNELRSKYFSDNLKETVFLNVSDGKSVPLPKIDYINTETENIIPRVSWNKKVSLSSVISTVVLLSGFIISTAGLQAQLFSVVFYLLISMMSLLILYIIVVSILNGKRFYILEIDADKLVYKHKGTFTDLGKFSIDIRDINSVILDTFKNNLTIYLLKKEEVSEFYKIRRGETSILEIGKNINFFLKSKGISLTDLNYSEAIVFQNKLVDLLKKYGAEILP
jgi:hypothetical protein